MLVRFRLDIYLDVEVSNPSDYDDKDNENAETMINELMSKIPAVDYDIVEGPYWVISK